MEVQLVLRALMGVEGKLWVCGDLSGAIRTASVSAAMKHILGASKATSNMNSHY